MRRALTVHEYFRDLLRGRSVYLLISLLLLFLIDPVFSAGGVGVALTELLFSVVLLASIYMLSLRRSHAWIAVLLAAPAVVTVWAAVFIPNVILREAALALLLLFLVYTLAITLWRVFTAETVTGDTIAAALNVYLMAGFAWGTLYTLVFMLSPEAFHVPEQPPHEGLFLSPVRFQAFLYFSFVTLTTVGYGDILPMSRTARSFANLEAILGQFYLAVLVARLVSQHASRGRE
jgi:hypothetical protein